MNTEGQTFIFALDSGKKSKQLNYINVFKNTGNEDPNVTQKLHTNIYTSHVKSGPCHQSMARSQVPDGGNGLQIGYLTKLTSWS
jgi:hypothetical protein